MTPLQKALDCINSSKRNNISSNSIKHGTWVGYGACEDIVRALAEKMECITSCDGCIHQPVQEAEHYPIECSECSRWYGDKFEAPKQ